MRRLTLLSFLASFGVQAWAANPEVDCESPRTTYAVNICNSREIDRLDEELKRYLAASRERVKGDQESLAALDASQDAWLTYTMSYCGAVHTRFRDGTIRGSMSSTCRIDHTRLRIHELWADYLTYFDSTPPVLPEPKK